MPHCAAARIPNYRHPLVGGEGSPPGAAGWVATLYYQTTSKEYIEFLRDEINGNPDNQTLLFQRLVKEAVHELGHTYNLFHCSDSTCVMHSSTYVEEIDLKSDRFCRLCDRLLPLERR